MMNFNIHKFIEATKNIPSNGIAVAIVIIILGMIICLGAYFDLMNP